MSVFGGGLGWFGGGLGWFGMVWGVSMDPNQHIKIDWDYQKSILTNDVSLILDKKSHDWLHSVKQLTILWLGTHVSNQ